MPIMRGRTSHLIRFPDASRVWRLISIYLVAICAYVSYTSVASAQSPGASPLVLSEAVVIALSANPRLAAMTAHAEALQSIPSQAAALPDPTFGFNAMNLPTDTFNLSQEPMTQLQVTFSQALPFPGKRQLREDAAQFEADAGLARVADTRLTLAAEVRVAWWNLFQLDRALEIVGQNQALMRDLIEIAQTKYSVGDGLQQDVLLAQLELSRLLGRELRLDGVRSTTNAMVNAYLDRPTNQIVILPQAPPSTSLPDVPTEAELLQAAAASRPALMAENAVIDAARARMDLSEKNLRPNFMVGAGYGYRQGFDPLRGRDRSDFLSLMFSVSVPLYSDSKQRQAIEQRSSELSQREFLRNDTLRSIQASVSSNRANYEAAREQVLLLETAIIPQAQQTVASMLAGYRVNEVDFLNVVNSQITLYNSQINYWEALSTAKAALAKLAAASGREVLYE
jgi:cobalt-zinc-cadmium efflux system outer membrane protein